MNIARRQAWCQMHKLVQPVGLLIARAKVVRAIHLFEEEFRDLAILRLSRKVGMVRRGETESVGRQSARKILAIRETALDDLSDADYAHMKKVIGYCRRHLAQRPWGDVTDTRWRWSLMNWGHDPVKG